VTAAAVIRCEQPDRLALAMARHFGHKVRVEQAGAVTSVFLRAGRFELEPGERRLAVRASAESEDDLAEVKRIAENHLARFARPEPLDIDWDAPTAPGEHPLERAAFEWIASYWNAEHLVRTRDWVVELDPGAGLALRLAGLTHDIERNFPGGPSPDVGDPDYKRVHAERSASIVRDWLASKDAPDELAAAVGRLVAAHETGGWREADLLQAADSLAFLEVNATRPAAWVRDGRCTPDDARARLRHMHDRIAVTHARVPADALLEDAERRFEEALASVSESR
jgi:hypothetical protein